MTKNSYNIIDGKGLLRVNKIIKKINLVKMILK